METLKRIKEDIELEIKREKKVNMIGIAEPITELQNKTDIISKITTNIKSGEYNLTIDDIDSLKETLNPTSVINNKISILKELIELQNHEFSKIIKSGIDNAKEQIKNSNLFEDLSKIIDSQTTELVKLKNKQTSNFQRISQLQRFSSSIKEDKFLQLSKNDLFDFLEYIKESELSKNDKRDLYLKIWINYTKYIEKENHKKNNTTQNKIIKNAKKVKEDLKNELVKNGLYHSTNIEENNSIEELILTIKEQKIVDNITEIIEKNNEKISITDKEIFDTIIMPGNYQLDIRKPIYSINNFDIICYDLKHNLIPNINNDNKTEIIKIYNYIIDLYKQKQCQENLEKGTNYTSKITKLTEAELAEVQIIKDLYFKELALLSEDTKKLINKNINNIDINQTNEEILFSLGGENNTNTKLIYYILLEKLSDEMTNYEEIINDEYNYYLIVYEKNKEELKKDVDLIIQNIKNIIKKIKEFRQKISDSEKEIV